MHTSFQGGCMDVLKEYQSRGKIRFVGFSSHGMTPLIVQAIETGQFDYVNLHYQVSLYLWQLLSSIPIVTLT